VAELVELTPARRAWGLAEGDEIALGRHALRRLGGGHRYEAYLAFDDRLHAVVVVKLVRPHLVEDEHTIAGLTAEAEMLARLDHPVIVRGFDAVLEGPRPHLVLEHLEGPRLSTLVRRHGPLPPEQLIPLALQLCSALHYLAAEDVVHLDVKPANIIMSAPPRLIDLSVALSTEVAARLDHAVGTDGYMAPEQCDPVALGPVGPEADVWGLGITLYRAVTGRRPFPKSAGESRKPVERWPQLVMDPAPLADPIPDAVAASILACIARDPTDRPSPAEVSEALEPVLAAQPRPRLAALRPRWR
jgi:eukaryotic-like serine/threonine-protein kinase